MLTQQAPLRARPVRPASPAALPRPVASTGGKAGFFMFVLVNAALFVRPNELFPDLGDIQLYMVLILACLVISLPAVLRQLTPNAILSQPVTACMLGLHAAVVFSHVWNGELGYAREMGIDYGKNIIYYLLCVGLLTTPRRMRTFLLWIVVFTFILTVVSVLNFNGIIRIESISTAIEGEEYAFYRRMSGMGLYNDPNDLCLILVTAMGICASRLGDRRSSLARLFWLVPIGFFLYAMTLTQSRGGLLGLLAGMMVLFHARFGWKKAVVLMALTLPLVPVLFAGRQTTVAAGEDTFQARVHLWSAGLEAMRTSPLFGIGFGRYQEAAIQVAHNSFVHAFVELGLFGGSMLLGVFIIPGWVMQRLDRSRLQIQDPDLRHLRPYVLAMLVAFAMGLTSLSRLDVVPTYMMIGLGGAYLQQLRGEQPRMVPRVTLRLAVALIIAGVISVINIQIFVKVFAQWGG